MRSRNLLFVLVAALLSACATVPGHPSYLPTAEELPKDPHGSWMVIKNDHDVVFSGELLAVEGDSIVYLWSDGPVTLSIPDREIKSAHLVRFDPQAGTVAGLTFVGVLSTITNGWALIFTAPAWIAVGTLATASRSNEPHMQLHKHDWKPIVPYARFPAGLPPGFLTTPPPPQQPVVAQKHESPKPAPKPWPVPESPADQHRFATHLGAGWAFHEQQGGTIEQGGVGFIGGIDARVQWPLFVSTRVLIAHRDVSADVSQGDFAKSGESFDLALLIGLQGHKKWFRPGFGIGPAAVGASVGDFTDLDFSVAFQGEVMVDVSPNVAAGVVLAYDKNDKRDFYVVALGLRFVFW